MPDYLSCGSCPVDFELADIVGFIEHKRQRCIDGSADSDQLECIKCSKRFHTPWPLLFHIQMDHQILIVRNLNQLTVPLSFKTSVMPIVQPDETVSMETDCENSPKTLNHRDVFTQTRRNQTSVFCCQPRNKPPCCQKIEPQCYDEPCLCPSVANVICTSESCYITLDNQQNPDLETNPANCCACPQGILKKESREVQTDFEYNDELDINFLLSNSSSDLGREFTSNPGNTFSQQTTPFTSQQYPSDFPMTVEKNWAYYTQAPSHITDHSNANYLANYETQNYQILMPNIRLPTNTNQTFVPSNSRLMVDTHTRSLTSSPNHIVPSVENQCFPLHNSCTSEQSLTSQTTLFQDSNPPFHYKALTNQDPHSLIMSNNSPMTKDSTPLFPRNENCSLSFIPSGSDISADFTTENFDNDKMENERKEFRFLCPNCGKRFRQKVHLRKHVMSQHARQKPHKCSQCGYTTVEKSHLTVHIRTHTGERPYTCRRCSYSSAQNCTLKSHYLRRHPGDQIECTLCGSYFITEQERNNHQRSCRIVNGVTNSGNSSGHISVADHSDSLKTA